MKTKSIKERVFDLKKLQAEEETRHNKRNKELFKIKIQIHKDCSHPRVKTYQLFPESLDVCQDCGDTIL